ncbi:MAG: 5-oxoprolinase subunit PxpB [Desulfatiglandales bacterium]
MEALPRFKVMGERALLAYFGEGIQLETHRYITAMKEALEGLGHPAIVEIVPGYTSLLILYDPLRIGVGEIIGLISEIRMDSRYDDQETRRVKIPVCYAGEFGPDLDFVASYNSISPEEVISIHSSTNYTVFVMGFIPGFPYMGILPQKIRAPRLETPRLSVQEGSVGIAENQTGIYPTNSPGGWRIIGRTPIKVFHPKRSDPFYLKPGDRVRFVRISEEEFKFLASNPEAWRP